MTYDSSNNNKKPDNRCYKCNVPIYFTSKEAETPSGKPTKNPLTGKVIPLDPSTHEYHECKPEDTEAFKQTDERKKKIEEWLSTASSNHDATNNNSMNLTLEKILTGIDQTNAVLEQMQTDNKADLAAIKNALKIGIDMPSSDSD